MKSLLLLTAAALLLAGHVSAATHSACVRHSAVTPYISTAIPDGAILTGAGDIGGCPTPIGNESVAITVCLQRDGVDVVCQSYTRGWNRYTRFPRQAGGSINATCAPGVWKTVVTGGDGFEPSRWESDPATFALVDESDCRHI